MLLSFAAVGISFLFRPLEHFSPGTSVMSSDGRVMLVVTLVLTGTATTHIGALPTYSQVGITTPILLLLPPYRAGSLGRWRAGRGGSDGR